MLTITSITCWVGKNRKNLDNFNGILWYGFFSGLVSFFSWLNGEQNFIIIIILNVLSSSIYIYLISKLFEEKEKILIFPDGAGRMTLWNLLLSNTLIFF